jgi:hypothetical protein
MPRRISSFFSICLTQHSSCSAATITTSAATSITTSAAATKW